ncbi:hypothetical protein BK138_06640 [Paenibacillus rhizosphaerae]|uniref:Uncharacterized protein n=2 Tax=Paenibacillus TaxID=44249 RepID=A0A1R1F274_9BACL|nr:hypothetical protein BK138_06640 [Paenibacillus rhizosphaerae]GIO53459.1 hypothetical protein J21TS7_17770 [Paenibacillus cineris]
MTYFYIHTFDPCIGGKAYIEGAFTLRTAWHKKEEAYHVHSLAVGGCSAGRPESPEERNMFREVIDNADQPMTKDRLH